MWWTIGALILCLVFIMPLIIGDGAASGVGKAVVFFVICGFVLNFLSSVALPDLFAMLAKGAYVLAGLSFLVAVGIAIFKKRW